jgi:hypothetical protein
VGNTQQVATVVQILAASASRAAKAERISTLPVNIKGRETAPFSWAKIRQ